jgi:hypothetical protein
MTPKQRNIKEHSMMKIKHVHLDSTDSYDQLDKKINEKLDAYSEFR